MRLVAIILLLVACACCAAPHPPPAEAPIPPEQKPVRPEEKTAGSGPEITSTTPTGHSSPDPGNGVGGEKGERELKETGVRAGARRLEPVWSQRPSVVYTPDPNLRWKDLDRALGQRVPATTLQPFAAANLKDEVEDSGELLSLALARQLQAIGWEVSLEGFSRKGLDQAGAASIGADHARNRKRLPVTVAGKGSFTIVHGPPTVSRIDAVVEIGVGDKRGRAAVDVRSEISAEKVPRASERARLAKERALASFVSGLFRDRALQASLCEMVRKVR